MPRQPSLARHESAGALEGVRVALRYARGGPPKRSDEGAYETECAEAALHPGMHRLGPFEIQVGLDALGEAAEISVAVRNRAEVPIHLESVVVGAAWEPAVPAGPGGLRFLRHGWQSWSFCGGRALDEGGAQPFASGPWVRSLHHGIEAPPVDRAGWHESDLVSVASAGEAGGVCLAGLLERGFGTGLVYLRRDPGGSRVRVEVETLLEVPLEPDERVEPEPVWLALGSDPNALLERYADALGERAGARTHAAFQAGWCTWYQFFHEIDEATLLRNLDALAARRADIPIQVVQLDDGYQRAIGDWLLTNEKFPRGLAPVAEAIRQAGFRPGIWTAPFSVVSESRVFEAHPEWLMRHGEGFLRGSLHPVWTAEGWVHVLDTSREDVRGHLTRVFAGLTGMGFTYHKVDFLHMAGMRGQAADPRMTRAGRVHEGLRAIRRGIGDDAFLLGCGCPQGAAVGPVDAMRIGPDVAPHWEPRSEIDVPGLEPALPSTASAIRSIQSRAWMHRRLWLNDPDCLMVRTRGTDLSEDEVEALAGAIGATGGMVIFSDDVPALDDAELLRLRRTLALAREVDAGRQRGAARAIDLVEAEYARGVVARTAARDIHFDLDLDAHRGELRSERHAPKIAVFCDYDGTFAVQDVGATLAKRHAGERRPALWERLTRGELTPWTYNMELLDGLALPEERLDAFLRSVEPDPGALDLVAFCEAQGLPFHVLSDGFDRNLDRLQELHGVRFGYDANRLWYEGGRWRLAPGPADPSCGCGTGTCKRSRIEAFRRDYPGTTLVHVGNGRVSDLCAADAADVVFAKDTLAEELRERGQAFEPFETLHDVREGLVRMLDG